MWDKKSHQQTPNTMGGGAGAMGDFSGTARRRIDDAKQKHRPGLKLHRWNRSNYMDTNLCTMELNPSTDPIARVHCADLSVEQFVKQFEERNLPVIIDGIPTEENWKATEAWKPENLVKKFSNCKFKCGEDDDGYAVKIKYKHFQKYINSQTDDSPLYIFDSSFDDHSRTRCLLSDYSVPKYFREDLFSLAGEERRPPYRWFLVGPKRSGTCVHIDPLATSAWNTLISGEKRWVLFPPDTPKRIAKAKDYCYDNEDDEACDYFYRMLPRLRRAHGLEPPKPKEAPPGAGSTPSSGSGSDSEPPTQDTGSSSGSERGGTGNGSGSGDGKGAAGLHMVTHEVPPSLPGGKPLRCIEFFQRPGETVYIPGGWWHAVFNTEDSIAITQNFCSSSNFDEVFRDTRTGRKKMARKWLWALEKTRPDLAARAERMNAEDKFVMPRYVPKRSKRASDCDSSRGGGTSTDPRGERDNDPDRRRGSSTNGRHDQPSGANDSLPRRRSRSNSTGGGSRSGSKRKKDSLERSGEGRRGSYRRETSPERGRRGSRGSDAYSMEIEPIERDRGEKSSQHKHRHRTRSRSGSADRGSRRGSR